MLLTESEREHLYMLGLGRSPDACRRPLSAGRRRLAQAAARARRDAAEPRDHQDGGGGRGRLGPDRRLAHPCILGRFTSGRLTAPWEFEREGEVVRVEPQARLIVGVGGATDLGVEAAIAGAGIIRLFEDWLRPHLASGVLEPVLEDWWQPFSGPFLYHPSRRLVPPPLRAFIDFVR